MTFSLIITKIQEGFFSKMYKKLSISVLSLSWTFGLIALLSFNPVNGQGLDHIETSVHESLTTAISNPLAFVLDAELEIPKFKIDWNTFGKLNSNWSFQPIEHVLGSVWNQIPPKSHALFDVKITFIQFFYTW